VIADTYLDQRKDIHYENEPVGSSAVVAFVVPASVTRHMKQSTQT